MSWENVAKWRDEFTQQAHKLAKLGHTDEQIADVFNVSVSTLESWKTSHEGFYEALSTGRTLALSEVANAMFKSAIGFEYTEEVQKITASGDTITEVYTKYAKPNPYAGKYILATRQRDKWTEKSESIHTNINIAKLDFSSLPVEVLQIIEAEQKKQLTEHAGHN